MADPARVISRPDPSTPTPTSRVGTIIPLAPRAPRLDLAADAKALMARIADGQKAAARLVSPGATDLFQRALDARTGDQAKTLIEDAEAMLSAAAATPLPSPRATPTRRPAGKDRILETLLENTQTRRGPQPQGRLPRL